MTQVLALAMPELFAAVAPCSGILFNGFRESVLALPEIANRRDIPVPIWMFGGEQESWLMPTVPDNGNETAETLLLWRKNNHLEPAEPQNWETGWSVHEARWNDLTYEKNGIPMVKYTWVDYMPHATMTEMSYRIWDEFFSHFSREGDKVCYL